MTASVSQPDTPRLIFRFEGLDADRHVLAARDMGHALIGVDKIVRAALTTIDNRRFSGRGRSGAGVFSLMAAEPIRGSVELQAMIEVAALTLPFYADVALALRAKMVERCVDFVLLRLGGRHREADGAMEKILDFMSEEHAAMRAAEDARDKRSLEDREREREHHRLMFDKMADTLRPAARDAVYPIGRSCRTLTTGSRGTEAPSIIDEPTADAIRAKEPLEVGDVCEITFKVDGLTRSKRHLRVYDPESIDDRFFTINVVDPDFERLDGPYSLAIAGRGQLRLTGKPTRKQDGTLHAFHAISAALVDGSDEF
jgi:hypothetical protein